MTLSHYVFSIAAVSVTLAVTVIAAPLQPVTSVDSKIGPPLSGGGDSVSPIVTPDGRFVLFASTANNLAMNGSSPYQAFVPPKLNVFRRDRVKGTTILVSVNTNGTGGGDADSIPTGLSSNGQFALFESAASTLTQNATNGVINVYARDLASNLTILVSINTNGQAGSGSSYLSPARRPVGESNWGQCLQPFHLLLRF